MPWWVPAMNEKQSREHRNTMRWKITHASGWSNAAILIHPKHTFHRVFHIWKLWTQCRARRHQQNNLILLALTHHRRGVGQCVARSSSPHGHQLFDHIIAIAETPTVWDSAVFLIPKSAWNRFLLSLFEPTGNMCVPHYSHLRFYSFSVSVKSQSTSLVCDRQHWIHMYWRMPLNPTRWKNCSQTLMCKQHSLTCKEIFARMWRFNFPF